jgi:ribokinase
VKPILVIGSLNMDLVVRCEALPQRGQTVVGRDFFTAAGGKGANQAVAAVRQGARVALIGCVGDDDDGAAYLRRLTAEHISSAGISFAEAFPTGVALIAVDKHGENMIVVSAGANGALSPLLIRARKTQIDSARVLLLQFEVPMPAVIEAIRVANRADVPVVLNPSPLREGFPWGRCALDTLVVNSGEARAIFGSSLKKGAGLRRRLARWHIQRLVITRGQKPTLCLDADGRTELPTLAVRPVDTVGAGDAFAGAYAARRAEGWDAVTAIRYANCAGALATLKPGAQEAIPNRAATEGAFRKLRT